ncbi:LacI family transcriptional regulator [Rhodobacterales bacterium]|nr:LacI family transcriptional regulator [Rhodobacterales bacterium]
MTSIKDLAQHLGISIGTVSRALNDKLDVKPATRERVLKAAQELGYVPNQAGRSLRQGSTGLVGFVLETSSEGMMQGDLFFIRVFDGMQSVFSEYGLHLMVMMSPSSEKSDAYLEKIVGRRLADALVLSSTRRVDPRIDFLADRKIPFVTLGRSQTDRGQPWLDLDFEGIIADAVDRLHARGHRRIALSLPRPALNLRYVMLDAYREQITRLGLPFNDRLVIETDPGDNGGVALAHHIMEMDDRPSAVIFSDHIHPFGLYRGLADMGMTPGRDLAILGIATRLASLLSPNLTHYRFHLHDLGRRIAQAVIYGLPHLHKEKKPPLIRERVPFTLIEGDSDAEMKG